MHVKVRHTKDGVMYGVPVRYDGTTDTKIVIENLVLAGKNLASNFELSNTTTSCYLAAQVVIAGRSDLHSKTTHSHTNLHSLNHESLRPKVSS